MHWKTKAAVFRLLSVIPFGQQIHYQLQRRVTREWPRPAQALNQLLDAARRILENAPNRRARFLEIGAGGDLAVAIALRLLGVGHVTCLDVSRLARLSLVRHAGAHLSKQVGASIPDFKSWDDVAAFGIDYVAPRRIQEAATPQMSIDCFYSVDTLEHIPRDDLEKILRHARELMAPNGVCVHLIDYSDHYARSDNDLSRFNFLTFDEANWRRFNSRYQYVNRLRHSQYLQLFANAGMKVIRAEPEICGVDEDVLEQLANPFRGVSPSDLFTLRAMLVATR